jgi:hypothetical protein
MVFFGPAWFNKRYDIWWATPVIGRYVRQLAFINSRDGFQSGSRGGITSTSRLHTQRWMHATPPFHHFSIVASHWFPSFPTSSPAFKAMSSDSDNAHTRRATNMPHRLPTTYAMLGHQVPTPPPLEPTPPPSDNDNSFDSTDQGVAIASTHLVT